MAAAEHRLWAPRPRIPRGFGPHPAGLASLGAEQPIEEGGGRGGDAGMRKQGSKVSFDLTQLRPPEVEHLLCRASALRPHPSWRPPGSDQEVTSAEPAGATVVLVPVREKVESDEAVVIPWSALLF